MILLKLLFLLMIANGTPVIAKKLLGNRLAYPLDGGAAFIDGRPLLGASKTIRGVLLAPMATAAIAPLVGLDWMIGALVGGASMAGDLCASFIKRRLNMAPHSMAIGLDQVPETLLPLLVCRELLGLTDLDIALGVAIFFISELLLSRFLYMLGIRDQPF